MRIIFICGCLEPGKDGVGDYTRKLGGELIRRGHQIFLIALYDRYINQTQEIDQESEATAISVLRLERELQTKKRVSKAKNKIVQFDPNWVSLQYVPTSFHSKGLNLKFPFLVTQLKGEFRWHLMIHEPWLVSYRKMSKESFVGMLQRGLLKLLIYKIGPRIIHTSNMFYQEILEKGGVYSRLLHLPGNIPVIERIEQEIIKEFVELGINKNSRKDWVVLGTFGKMRANIDYLALLRTLLERTDLQGKKIAFFSIGKAGIHCDEIFRSLEQNYKENLLVHKFGERTTDEISSFFQLLDYGVTSVPEHLLGKSGAYAAMRNHGLKILVPERKVVQGEIEMKNYSSNLFTLEDHEFSSEKVVQYFLCSLNGKSDIIFDVKPVRQ